MTPQQIRELVIRIAAEERERELIAEKAKI